MHSRFRFQLLLLILTGAVLDGGTLGFRAAWASCGDWLAQSEAGRHGQTGFMLNQMSTDVPARFSVFYLREDEKAQSTMRQPSPLQPLCGCTDPACSMQPALPVSPVPAGTPGDSERSAYWLHFHAAADGDGQLMEVDSCHPVPLRRASDIFRPPRSDS